MQSIKAELLSIRRDRRRVLIVGLGVTGVETIKFVTRLGIDVVAVERSSEAQYLNKSKFKQEIEKLRKDGAVIQFGIDGEGISALFENVGLCVLSPGVSLESSVSGALRRHGIPFVSELELGLELTGWPSVIVTGSNGKSTTVGLIEAMLLQSGKKARLCGNIGIPVVADLDSSCLINSPEPTDSGQNSACLVVEASSYQLEACRVLKPKVGVLLNISDNHLERHGTLDRYFEAKAKLFAQQDETDFAVLNRDDAKVRSLWGRVKSKPVGFGRSEFEAGAKMGARFDYQPNKGHDVLELIIDGIKESYDLQGTSLIGLHNRYDIAAASLAARLMGASAEAIKIVIQSFKPLEHRIEPIVTSGPIIINDSKSTTVASSVAAFQAVQGSYPQAGIVLLIGGQAKAGSWEPLLKTLKQFSACLKPVVCFGGDGSLLANHMRSASLPFVVEPNLKSATQRAIGLAEPKDVILLSPGCASFDEFSDFEERGNMFKLFIGQLAALGSALGEQHRIASGNQP